MKINWFSPLPPAKTDIAQYTMRVLPAFSNYCEIELWTDQLIYDSAINRDFKVNSYQLGNIPWKKINQGDLNVYHIGNNPDFHGPIWQVSCKCPGIVVLHDLRLQHFFAALYTNSEDRDGYLANMQYYYGEECEQIVERFWQGQLSTEFMGANYPLTPLALKNSLAVVTHSLSAFKHLRQENEKPVSFIPLPYPNTSRSKSSPKQQQFYQLVIFGYLGANRCLDLILEALASFSLKESFRLDIYGEVANEELITSKINKLALANMVKLHGFVEEDTLEIALKRADLAFNLRYPTMGEASGSQLRIWSHALASLVTRIGWYEELPENTVGFVRVNHEIEDIHRHLKEFLNNPEMYKTMGENGQLWLQTNHDPNLYAKSFLEFAQIIQDSNCGSTQEYFVGRLSIELALWSNENCSDLELERITQTLLVF
jgi:glycosyltransferase involved in cell wall biosynthesis